MPPLTTTSTPPAPAISALKNRIPFLKRVPSRIVALMVVVVLAGVGTGYFLSTQASPSSVTVAPGVKSIGKEVGITDGKILRDCAQGILETNDPSDKKTEGSHKLIREGGPSQTLYMTSSVLALDEYIGKKVEVCGETVQSKKVAWFMDVGRLKLLE